MKYARLLALVCLAACTPSSGPQAPAANRDGTLIAFPVESEFSRADAQLGDHLRRARVWGYAPATLSKVSLETVQLAIECTDATLDCFSNVGRQLHADALLFGTIEPGGQAGEVVITVSLFDVRSKAWINRLAKKFPTEDDALYELKDIVAAVTKKGP